MDGSQIYEITNRGDFGDGMIGASHMLIPFHTVQTVKQALLIISVLYFYGMAFTLAFQRATYGLDRPLVFIFVGGIFLIALFLEMLVVWWPFRARILAGTLLALAYAYLGFVVAPALFGAGVLAAVFLAPVAITFVIGFSYAFVHIIYRNFFIPMKLTPEELQKHLASLPGWEGASGGLEKIFRFASFTQALNFINRCGALAQAGNREPDISLSQGIVRLRLFSRDAGGVTEEDAATAKKIDGL